MKSEADMVGIIKTYFRKEGFKVATEVPMLSKRIDVVCLERETHIIAIEAKLQNWRRGLQQASTYRIGSDFVYLAIQRDFSHRVDKNLLRKMSVGLIVVDQNGVEIILEAPEHMIVHQRIRENIISYCRGECLASI